MGFAAVNLLMSRINEPSLNYRTMHTETSLETQKLQGIPVSHIPLEEGTAVQIFSDKSDPGLSPPGHFLYK